MNRYQRVEKPREGTPSNENEIRVTTQGRMSGYITYAASLLQKKGLNKIIFKAMGRAINKTVLIVELLKIRIVDLHQNTAIGSTDITDAWEPLEEGLLPLETIRHVSTITITLSKQEHDSSVGYQSPSSADQVKPNAEYDCGRDKTTSSGDNGGRGFGRGSSGRGRRRGSGGPGKGRFDRQKEANGYEENPPAPSKGRRGRRRSGANNGGRGRDARSNGPTNAGAANSRYANSNDPINAGAAKA